MLILKSMALGQQPSMGAPNTSLIVMVGGTPFGGDEANTEFTQAGRSALSTGSALQWATPYAQEAVNRVDFQIPVPERAGFLVTTRANG